MLLFMVDWEKKIQLKQVKKIWMKNKHTCIMYDTNDEL